MYFTLCFRMMWKQRERLTIPFYLIILTVMDTGGSTPIMKRGKAPTKSAKRYVDFTWSLISNLVVFNFIGFHLDSIDHSSIKILSTRLNSFFRQLHRIEISCG